jgi:hypothetical protein
VPRAFAEDGELPAACLASPDTNWLPDGYWYVEKGDKRVKDFPPE